MKKYCLAAFLAASAFASPAFAQEAFSGAHVGVEAGWSHSSVGQVQGPAGTVAIDSSRDATTGGVFVGYDHLLASHILVGVEGGLSFSTDDEIRRSTSGSVIEVDPKRSFQASARAGYVVGNSTLLYVRGGYTNVRATTTVTGPTGALRRSSDLDGWLVGGGVERMLRSNVSARLEYRYSDLGKQAARYDRHEVLLGVAYHF
ncbi:MAG: hypothetical protein JWR80_9357 [Bradyrhizobium sp.]|nr:hypothetical protein [Bradyrhizobium sp.]